MWLYNEISARYHRLLIYDEKRNTEIDGMGPFKPKVKLLSLLAGPIDPYNVIG